MRSTHFTTAGAALVAAGLLLTSPAIALGQANSASGSIGAQANVLALLNVRADRDLDFGDVIPGVSRTVSPDPVDAGVLEVTGAAGLSVVVDWDALPTELNHTGGLGATLPISFGVGAGAHGPNSSTVAGTFDPDVPQTLSFSPGGTLWLFIGGTVDPDSNQEPGRYIGTLGVTVQYTGT